MVCIQHLGLDIQYEISIQTKMLTIAHRTFILPISLLCACAAVNMLFHALQGLAVMKNGTEYFIELDADEHSSLSSYRRGKPSFQTLPQNNSTETGGTPSADSNMSYRRLHNAIEHRTFMFSLNNHTMCYRDALNANEHWTLVIVVISKVEHFIVRNAIRNTWASELGYLNAKIVFLLGQSGRSYANKQVRKEAELYRDVVQVDLVDDYKVLSFKSIAMLQWLNDYCANSNFYMKADDDTYINVENVIKELNRHKSERFFLCHVFRMAPPIREHFSKWYVSDDEYPGRYYPTYCSGSAYGFSSNILSDLYRSVVQTKIFRMEDVFISGLAADEIEVRHVHSWRFSFLKKEPTGCAYQNTSSGHDVSVKQMYVIYAQLKNKEIDCNTNQNKYLLNGELENYI